MKKLLVGLLLVGLLGMTACGHKTAEQAEEPNNPPQEIVKDRENFVETAEKTIDEADAKAISNLTLTEKQIALFKPTADSFVEDVLDGSMTIEEMETRQARIVDGYISTGDFPENAHELFNAWKLAIGYYEQLSEELMNKGFMEEAQIAIAKIPEEKPEITVETEKKEEVKQVAQEQTKPATNTNTQPNANTQTQTQSKPQNTQSAVQQSPGIIGDGFDAEGYQILSTEEIYQIYGQNTRPAIEDNWLADLIKEAYKDKDYVDELMQPRYINELEMRYLSTGKVSGNVTVDSELILGSFEESYKRALESEARRISKNYGVSYEVAYEYNEKYTEYVNTVGETDTHNAALVLLEKNGYDPEDSVAYTNAWRTVNLTRDKLVSRAMEQGVSFEQAYADALYEIAGIKPVGQ